MHQVCLLPIQSPLLGPSDPGPAYATCTKALAIPCTSGAFSTGPQEEWYLGALRAFRARASRWSGRA